MARHHSGGIEIRPNCRQVFLFDTKQIEPLTARHFYQTRLIFIRSIGDGAQFIGRSHAAPHTRHDRIGAVLLDVGVHAFVDETALLIVHRHPRPCTEQIVIQGRAAGCTAVGRGPMLRLHHFGNGFQCLFDNRVADIFMGKAGAFAHRLDLPFTGKFLSKRQREEVFDQPCALAAASRCFAARPDSVQILRTGIDAGDNFAF